MASGTDRNNEAIELSDVIQKMAALPPDTLNEIGVLKRREIEARIIGPIVDALSKEFDRARVLDIVGETIIQIARRQGAERAAQVGDNSLRAFSESSGDWSKNNALETEVLEKTEDRYDFNVTRCRYAEMYRSLGMAELGATLSCNRDYSSVEGFNPDIELTREQTIMKGAPCCTFRYRMKRGDTSPAQPPAPPASPQSA